MVDGWDVGHMFPFGHYVTSLGPVGEVRGLGGGCHGATGQQYNSRQQKAACRPAVPTKRDLLIDFDAPLFKEPWLWRWSLAIGSLSACVSSIREKVRSVLEVVVVEVEVAVGQSGFKTEHAT